MERYVCRLHLRKVPEVFAIVIYILYNQVVRFDLQ